MNEEPVARLHQMCESLPEATVGVTVHHPSIKLRDRGFVMFTEHGRPAYWIKAAPGIQPELVASDPDRFFVPPYVGPKGWVGVWLDHDVDWDEIAELVLDAYRLVAPKCLLTQLDQA